jgi:hypothetical protein
VLLQPGEGQPVAGKGYLGQFNQGGATAQPVILSIYIYNKLFFDRINKIM